MPGIQNTRCNVLISEKKNIVNHVKLNVLVKSTFNSLINNRITLITQCILFYTSIYNIIYTYIILLYDETRILFVLENNRNRNLGNTCSTLMHFNILLIVKKSTLLPYNNYFCNRSKMYLKVSVHIKLILLKMYGKKNFYSVQFAYLNHQINLQRYLRKKKYFDLRSNTA